MRENIKEKFVFSDMNVAKGRLKNKSENISPNKAGGVAIIKADINNNKAIFFLNFLGIISNNTISFLHKTTSLNT